MAADGLQFAGGERPCEHRGQDLGEARRGVVLGSGEGDGMLGIGAAGSAL